VIILDVMMPMVDGFATLNKKKRRTIAALQSHFPFSAKNKENTLKRTLH
jgi:CheY-like chemotaxis protein